MTRELIEKYPILGSSVDPEKLALTVKGILLGVVTILVTLGVDATGLELNTLVDAIVNAIQLIGGLVSAIMTIYGLSRKIYNKVKN